MKRRKNYVFVIAAVLITVFALLVMNYVAVTYCVGKLGLFMALMLVLPMIIIAAVSFIIGQRINWNWKCGICIALVFSFLSWGTSKLIVFIAGNSLDHIEIAESEDNSQYTSNDELMDELYNELDKKAYEYMLEQGLISEGEEIFGGDKTVDSKESGKEKENKDVNQNDIASSEIYIGIQKSDPVTEQIGNGIIFLLAYGLSFAGYRSSNKKMFQ